MTFLAGTCLDSGLLISAFEYSGLLTLWYTFLWLIAAQALGFHALWLQNPQISFGQMPPLPWPNARKCHWPPLGKRPTHIPKKGMKTTILHGEGTKFTVFGCFHVIKSKGNFVQNPSLFLPMLWQIPFYLFIFYFLKIGIKPDREIHLDASWMIDWNVFEYRLLKCW